MSYSKIIHEYLDGGRLATPEEEVLFKTLASDEEIRSEFNKQMKLHMMVQRDMNSITPPSAVTSQLFGSLGFAMPTEHSGAAAVNSDNGVLGYFKKYSVFLFALLLGTSIAGISYFTYQNKQLQNEIAALSNSQNTGAEASNSVKSSKNIPLVNSEGIDPDNALSALQEDHSANSNYARNGNSTRSNGSLNTINSRNQSNFNNSSNIAAFADNNSQSQTNSSNMSNGNNYTLIDPAGSNFSSAYGEFSDVPRQYGSSNHIMNESIVLMGIEPYYAGDDIIDNTQWRVTFRRIAPMSYNDDHLGANENNVMNNIAVGVFKKIDDYHSVGIELGWEQFGQSFVMSNENITFTQHQNPMLFWAGASYSFTPVEWLIPYELYPYARITAGGTSVGPVFKAQSGLNWRVAGNFNILLGYEYGNLLYNVDGVLYNSPKTGIIFGAKFKF